MELELLAQASEDITRIIEPFLDETMHLVGRGFTVTKDLRKHLNELEKRLNELNIRGPRGHVIFWVRPIQDVTAGGYIASNNRITLDPGHLYAQRATGCFPNTFMMIAHELTHAMDEELDDPAPFAYWDREAEVRAYATAAACLVLRHNWDSTYLAPLMSGSIPKEVLPRMVKTAFRILPEEYRHKEI